MSLSNANTDSAMCRSENRASRPAVPRSRSSCSRVTAIRVDTVSEVASSRRLVTSPGRRPCLRVTNRAAKQLTEDIYEGDGRFWWRWAEPIAEVRDVAAAAEKVRQVLQATGNGAAGGECTCVVGCDPLCAATC